MSKTSRNSMSEDELLSALGFSVGEEAPKDKKASAAPSVIDGDVLIDILAPESKPARRSRASSERERAREEQEREKSLRSKEWRRELEQQQMRAAAMAEEKEAAEQAAARSNLQPLIPNASDMRDIEDVAVIANEKRRAADEVERRRLAMQEQVRRRQEEVAAEAKAAAEHARRRAEEQEASRRMQQDDRMHRPPSPQPSVQQRVFQTPSRRPRPYNEQGAATVQSQRNSQPLGPSAQQGRPMAQGGRSSSQPVRPSTSQPSRSGQILPRGTRQVDPTARQRPQGFSQDLPGQPAVLQNAPVQQAPVVPPAAPEPCQAPAQQPERVECKRPKKERAPRSDDDRMPPQSKESPLGVVLIVLAVLCVLVAASLLTGLWDISNL